MSPGQGRLAPPWILLLVTAGIGCSQAPIFESPARPNFIILMVDTLRADHLHFSNNEAPRTPGFDELQRSSTWFTHAYTTSPWTLPAVASLFTAQLSARHGATDFGSELAEGAPTLARALHAAGYTTRAWSASRLIVPARGILQGFDGTSLVMHPEHGGVGQPIGSPKRVAPAEAVSRAALPWIQQAHDDENASPFLVYLHYMEPHTPYLCPPQRESAVDCVTRATSLNQRLHFRDWGFDDKETEFLRELYNADVARMDAALSDLLSNLSNGGILDDTWVILLADHGELLGERGYFLHGKALYEPLVRIPLLFRNPTGRGSRVDTPVSLIDVAPTIVELAGVDAPPEWQGRSLARALEGEPLSSRPVVAELYMADPWSKHRLAVVHGNEKLVLDVSGGLQRFQIHEDQSEEQPIAGNLEELERILSTAGFEVDVGGLLTHEESEPTPEQREQLKALGYLDR